MLSKVVNGFRRSSNTLQGHLREYLGRPSDVPGDIYKCTVNVLFDLC